MKGVRGTAGYEAVVDRFAAATRSVDFTQLHRHFLDHLPESPARILDVGAGIGRDAAELAAAGHDVVAVEPCDELRATGQELYASSSIVWVNDALPPLGSLGVDAVFDWVLASAVHHHLDRGEQTQCVARLAQLLAPAGALAMTLRNGPAGAGRNVFPVDVDRTCHEARARGLTLVVDVRDEPSQLPGKRGVTWAHVLFRK